MKEDKKGSIMKEDKKAEEQKVKKTKFICVHQINEDGVKFEIGDAYTGKKSKYLLEQKTIKKA